MNINISARCRFLKGTANIGLSLLTTFAGMLLGSTCLHADTLAYAYQTGGDAFGISDLNTGAYTTISSPCNTCGSFAAYNGNLYGLGGGGVYQINPSTGAYTLIGGTNFPNIPLGSSTSGLYFVGWNVPNPNAGGALGSGLFRFNPSNGAITLVGSLGLPQDDGATELSTSNDSNMLFYEFSLPTNRHQELY